jgi:hypothetical protein
VAVVLVQEPFLTAAMEVAELVMLPILLAVMEHQKLAVAAAVVLVVAL